MQYHWLNKQNNDKLIIFFAGWSFDFKPFEFLDCEDFDVLMVYDYDNNLSNALSLCERAEFQHEAEPNVRNSGEGIYSKKYLIAWSMGVFTAYQMREHLPKFTKKLAVNGTPFPVDNEYGIPEKPFLLTLRHVKTGLEGKFYQNIFEKSDEFERYLKTPVERSIENRVEELKSLYDKIKTVIAREQNNRRNIINENSAIADQVRNDATSFFDKAIVSTNDKIIPTKNQLNFWQDKAEIIDSGHFPFYNFKSWNEIICK